jgi:transposase
MLSDEMMIVLKPDGKLKVWRKAAEKWRPECLGYMRECQGSTLELMVWGCVTYFGMGTLAFINGNVNSEKNINTLDNYLWPTVIKHYGVNRWIFQEDNAPTHKSRLCEAWKQENNIPILLWPAQSPDSNLIENVWLLLKTKLREVSTEFEIWMT